MGILNNPEYKLTDGYRILVCEDHPINSRLTGRMLESFNVEYTVAEDGKTAVDKFKASSEGYYNLILMDIHIPIISGTEAAAQIRALERADSKTIPIIAMTGDLVDSNRAAYCKSGIDDCLGKPLEPEILYRLLTRYMVEKTDSK